MNIGFFMRNLGPLLNDVVALHTLGSHAENLGFDSIWVGDHIAIPAEISSRSIYTPDPTAYYPTLPVLEPLAILGYLAGITQGVRLGTHILVLPYRNPILTAKQVATLDFLSNGRITLGIGPGWMEEEFIALGHDFFDQRGAVTDEQINIMKSLWTNDIVQHRGKFYDFPSIGQHPHPIQRPHPPIWVGGHSQAAIRRAAYLGDGWMPLGLIGSAGLNPTEMESKIHTLRSQAQSFGRDPADIEICFSTFARSANVPGDESRPLFAGTPEQVASDIASYQTVGVNRFIFDFPGNDILTLMKNMEDFAKDVMPLTKSCPLPHQ